MDTPPLPPQPANLPDWANDELPLLTETVGEPGIPLLSEVVPATLRPAGGEPVSPPRPPAPAMSAPTAASMAATAAAEPLAQIERELHAAAQLIMQEVIDDYMLQIEAELHRRLEEHLAKVLRAGRR